MKTVPIHAIWQGGDIFPAVILQNDGVWMKYVQLGARDVRGAWLDKPTPHSAPSANNRGLNRRQDEAFRKIHAREIQHAVNLMKEITC
jgi:hypothetical protein